MRSPIILLISFCQIFSSLAASGCPNDYRSIFTFKDISGYSKQVCWDGATFSLSNEEAKGEEKRQHTFFPYLKFDDERGILDEMKMIADREEFSQFKETYERLIFNFKESLKDQVTTEMVKNQSEFLSMWSLESVGEVEPCNKGQIGNPMNLFGNDFTKVITMARCQIKSKDLPYEFKKNLKIEDVDFGNIKLSSLRRVYPDLKVTVKSKVSGRESIDQNHIEHMNIEDFLKFDLVIHSDSGDISLEGECVEKEGSRHLGFEEYNSSYEADTQDDFETFGARLTDYWKVPLGVDYESYEIRVDGEEQKAMDVGLTTGIYYEKVTKKGAIRVGPTVTVPIASRVSGLDNIAQLDTYSGVLKGPTSLKFNVSIHW